MNELELLIIATKYKRLTESESLSYLKKHGYDISTASYWRTRGKITALARERLFQIAKNMEELHYERITSLAELAQHAWKILDETEDPEIKLRAIRELREMQPFISAYDEATQNIMEEAINKYGKEQTIDLSQIGI